MELTLYEYFKAWALRQNWCFILSGKEGALTSYEWLTPTGQSVLIVVNKNGYITSYKGK